MSPHLPARTALRCALTGTAHAEVESDAARALAVNATLSFVSEAESDTAGLTQVRVVPPKGIAPGDVTLTDAPEGWELKSADDGYTLSGPALATGADGEHSIRGRRLPDAEQLVFRTVETYDDGEVARWIELPTDDKEGEQPAPVLRLEPAASGNVLPPPARPPPPRPAAYPRRAHPPRRSPTPHPLQEPPSHRTATGPPDCSPDP
ncbi:YcnI family protein [Streptomyces sp. MNU76]|uniref:DUF1775 domain-containing protein n=1 Tax=Streptomyces sp. MNU76 TaxID=2560026 RepID=UPI001E65B968|nr:DUF1775 domain-containing protein [Streptomyces sp. MNU76]MCC9710914.1 YcnI family protein [Streptomyces sp. MNU76]